MLLPKGKSRKFLYVIGGLVVALAVGIYALWGNFDITFGQESAGFTTPTGPAQAVQAGDDMTSHHGGGNKVFNPLPAGTKAPSFSLSSTEGKVISLSDYQGKNVFIFFNEGVMCDICWQEISKMEKSKVDFDKLNAVILPISVDDAATWKPVIEMQKIITPILIDSDRKVSAAYHVLGTPSSMHSDRPGHTYIHIDPQGNVHSSADFPSMNVPAQVLLDHLKGVGA